MVDSHKPPLDDAVRRFLRSNVTDFDQLEILRLLVERGEVMLRDAIAEQLSIRSSEVRDALSSLAGKGLVRHLPGPGAAGALYHVEDAKTDALVHRVLQVWQQDRLAVIRFMNEIALERALRLFADAFVLRGK